MMEATSEGLVTAMARREGGRAVARTLSTEDRILSITISFCRWVSWVTGFTNGFSVTLELALALYLFLSSGEAMARADKAKTVRALNCMLTSTNKRV